MRHSLPGNHAGGAYSNRPPVNHRASRCCQGPTEPSSPYVTANSAIGAPVRSSTTVPLTAGRTGKSSFSFVVVVVVAGPVPGVDAARVVVVVAPAVAGPSSPPALAANHATEARTNQV